MLAAIRAERTYMNELAFTLEERLALNTVCTYSLANTGLAPEIKQELLAVLNAFNHHCMEETNELNHHVWFVSA